MSETIEEKTYGRLVRIPEAAELLGVAPDTIRWWIQMGRIESHKLYGKRLISEDEIVRLIELSRVPARRETLPARAAA